MWIKSYDYSILNEDACVLFNANFISKCFADYKDVRIRICNEVNKLAKFESESLACSVADWINNRLNLKNHAGYDSLSRYFKIVVRKNFKDASVVAYYRDSDSSDTIFTFKSVRDADIFISLIANRLDAIDIYQLAYILGD